jgi:hypothetical protein
MKKFIMSLSLLLTIGLTTMFANTELKVDPRVLSAFQIDFSLANDVKWELKAGRYLARFNLYGQIFIARYSTEAELINTIRNIQYNQLPISILRSLEKKYSNADFINILEESRDNKTNYFIQVVNEKKKILVQSDASGFLWTIKKMNI